MKKFAKITAVVMALMLALVVLASCGEEKGTESGKAPEQNTERVKVIDIALSEEQYAYCVNQKDTELLSKVNEYLAKIKEDGTFDKICNNYFGDGTPVEHESCKRDNNKDQLVVATATGFEPFEMVEAAKYSGIDLEIAAGLAEFLGKELVIEDMQFASVVTSVQQGICDIGMAGLTITPAREEIVTFSDSYYSANQMLLVPAANTEFDACKTKEDVEAILDTKDSKCKIGFQIGTTGGIYIEGDLEDENGYGFKGLKVTKMGYDYAALAATAMVNGEIDYVIVDDAPAKAIAKSINAVK